MLTRKKSLSFSMKNGPNMSKDNIVPPPEEEAQKINIDSLDYYLHEIIKTSSNTNSSDFRVAISSFQKFIFSKYNAEKVAHNERTFLNELFQSISINREVRTTFEYAIFTKAIVSVEIGDKMILANYLSNTINCIKPDTNKTTWENLGYVLEFLKKSMKNGAYLIISNLKYLSYEWIQDKQKMESGFYLLGLLLKKFCFYLESSFSQIHAMIISGIAEGGGPKAAFKVIDIIINIQKTNPSFNLLHFCKTLLMFLKIADKKNVKNIMHALNMILDEFPEYEKSLTLLYNPIDLLRDTKNGDNIIAGLQLAPFYVRTLKPTSDSNDFVNRLIDLYYVLLSHRSQYRVEALISLANTTFAAKMNKYTISQDLQTKFFQKLTKYFDIDQVYYTYIAFMTMRDTSSFDNDCKLIFSVNRPINQYILDGFCKYCHTLKQIPSDKANEIKQTIDRTFLVYFNTIIINQSSADRIKFVLEGILKLDISMDAIQIPLAIKYSLLMNNPDYKVRKLTTKFIIKYQKEKPTLEMLCRILSIIGTEFTSLRGELFQNLRREPEDPAIIPLLVSLLHDSSNLIQKCSLHYLVDLIHFDGVPNIITDFLRDTCESMKLSSSSSSKTSLRFFEIVCEAYKNKKNPIFQTILIPFADFLINHILQSEILPHIGLTILSYIIPIALKETINKIDLDKLVMHIEQSLVPHSSKRRLDSTFDLLLACLKKTDLRFTIYEKHLSILNRLHSICELNQSSVNQMELLHTFSTIGAINPELIKTQLNSIFDNEESSDVIVNTPMYFLSISQSDKIDKNLTFTATGIAVKTLLEMMSEKVLSTLFSAAIEALEKIIKSGSIISDVLLKEVFKHISDILENDDNPSDLPKMLSALQAMIAFLREKIEPLIPSIVEYIYSNWNKFDHSLLIKIVEFIPIRCGHELLKPHIFKLASLFVADLNNCPIQMADDIYSVFDSLSIYLPIISSVIYPPLIVWINNHAYNTKACISMLQKLASLLASKKKEGKEYSAQIIQTMIRIVHVNKELHNASLSVIRILADIMGPRFILYLPSLQSTFTISHTDELTNIIAAYKSGNIYTQTEKGVKARNDAYPQNRNPSTEVFGSVPNLSQSNFEQNKPPSESSDENQWLLWWDKFSDSFFENCPCRSVKICKAIAKRYPIMKDKLFPLAFCINRTIDMQKYQWLDEWFKIIITSSHGSILRTFLAIYEIYEVLEIKVLKLDPRIVAKKAMETDSYALAIHIYENIFESEIKVTEDTSQSLITLNQHLGFTDAANGILKVSNTQEQSELSEKLGLWEDALAQYLNESKHGNSTGSTVDFISVCLENDKAALGIMNCLSRLSRFSELVNVANSVLNNPSISSEMRIDCLRFAAFASWHLFDYDNFKQFANQFIIEYTKKIKENEENENTDEISENYYIIIMANILNKNFKAARLVINKYRSNSCNKLFPLIGQNYELVYEDSSIVSSLSEAEEVIEYLEQDQIAKSPEKAVREEAYSSMSRIKQLWKIRFSNLKPISSVLHRYLCIRSIVLPISEQSEGFLKLIDSSIEQKRLELAESILQYCEKKDPKCEKYRTMRCKLIWARGEKKQAIESLSSLELTKETNLILAQWIFEYGDPQKARVQLEKEIAYINGQDKQSMQLYNADLAFSEWEVWANINLALFKSNPTQITYIVDSLEGLMNALLVAKSNSVLTFTLRILHVLFNHECNELFDKFEGMLKSGRISLSVWPDVVIQLMSRLASSNFGLRNTIEDLITTVGLIHPHSVLLSLMVLTYFENTEKQRISREIINKIKQKHPLVVSSLSRFSFELQKVALSWWEATISKIDEVSRIYADNIKFDSILSNGNSSTNINDQISPQCHFYLAEICKGLKSLDKMVLSPPSSFYEISYSNEFGHTMEVASHWRKVYERTKEISAFQSSWNYYTTAFYAIRPLLSNLSNFELNDASPYLSNFTSKTAQIPVPGTYSVSNESEPILIESFHQKVTVIDSKQRPRRIDLFGDDGNKYTFLLKAHEDTRLDERIMQFFSFINTCIRDKKKTNKLTDNFRNRLTITTYKVSPLTPEVGMIGFVKNCMTLFDVVKNYRTKKSIKIEAEYNLVSSNCDKYDDLPLCDKRIRSFLKGYEACDGNDIKKDLFNNSDDSMNWMQRRTTYTTSLAMTSMAGYVLGLGDRHLCNIMINKRTGKLVHIDFGDSFEVAQYRSNYPEKVPFRLTRLLQNALEVSRIEGTFRKSCENTLGMMRTNSEQIIGLLSAFIYDPLKQWTEKTKKMNNDIKVSQISMSNSNDESSNINEEEKVINRISAKLCGNDFDDKKNLNVEEQVERLIKDATDVKNLCMMYKGWYPWW